MRLFTCFKGTVFIVLAIWLVFLPSHALAKEKNQGKVYLVAVDALAFSEIFPLVEQLPNIKNLTKVGAVGLLNTNTGARKTPDAAYLTIGAGAKSVGSEYSGMSYDISEQIQGKAVSDLYQNFYGKLPESGSILNLSVNQLNALNIEKNYGALPGRLGTLLRSNGYKTAVFGGQADYTGIPQRYAPLMLMDTKGIVDYGSVENNLNEVATDSQALADVMKIVKENEYDADVYLFDFRETASINQHADLYSADSLKNARLRALGHVDSFVGHLWKAINPEKDLVILFSPTSSSQGIRDGATLTMIVAAGKNITPGSMLTSGSTRRAGIVVNTDIAPTICAFFNLESAGFVGRQLSTVSVDQAPSILATISAKTLLVSTTRPTIIQTFILCQVIILLIVFALIMVKTVRLNQYRKVLLSLLFAMATIPFVLLVEPLFIFYFLPNVIPIIEYIFPIAGALFFVVVLRPWGENPIRAYMIMAFLTMALIVGDTITGSKLAIYSTLSYDPVIGARFYGIGNEYMGVLLGSWIIFFACLFQMYPAKTKVWRVLSLLGFVGVSFVLAAPTLGANVGGTIACILGLGYTNILFSNGRLSFKLVFMVISVLILVLGVMVTIDLLRPENVQTHLAKLVSSSLSGGVGSIIDTFTRKIAMNFRLLAFTRWSWMLFTSLIVLFAFYFRPVGLLQRVLRKYTILRLGFIGSVIAATFAFIFNDSGVVAVGTLNIFPVMLITSLMLRERATEEESSKEMEATK